MVISTYVPYSEPIAIVSYLVAITVFLFTIFLLVVFVILCGNNGKTWISQKYRMAPCQMNHVRITCFQCCAKLKKSHMTRICVNNFVAENFTNHAKASIHPRCCEKQLNPTSRLSSTFSSTIVINATENNLKENIAVRDSSFLTATKVFKPAKYPDLYHKQRHPIHKQSHCARSNERRLMRKYRRYIRNVRKNIHVNDGRFVSLQPADGMDFVLQNQSAIRGLPGETPWVKLSDNGNLSKNPVDRENSASSQSTQWMDMLPTVSPKAHDPSNIFADLRIPPQRIILKRLVMKGTFGRLYEAKLRVRTRINSRQFALWKTVFVKTVAAYATREQMEVFLKDASKLASIRNKRIASVIATTQQDSALNGATNRAIPWLVYQHAELGNLKHFLRTPTRSSNENMSTKGLTADQILILGLQIVQAVEYLHHNGIVHGDVATRNCLLRSQACVTLCDSALSRDFFPEDYQCLGDNTNRPIKWLAFEALVGRTFSRATDVWSVGVTLWELVTKGQQPYSMFDPFEMPDILRSGYRLEQPSNCPEEMWYIIRECWKMLPSERPSIEQLRNKLEQFKLTVDNYV